MVNFEIVLVKSILKKNTKLIETERVLTHKKCVMGYEIKMI